MRKTLFICFFISCFLANGQTCDFESEIIEISRLNETGYFKEALSQISNLSNCQNFSKQQKIRILLEEHKAYRNITDYIKAENSLVAATQLLKLENKKPDFELRFLMAEIYAQLGDYKKYLQYITPIRDSVFSKWEPNNLLIGRFELTSYRTTNKNNNLTQTINHLLSALQAFDKLANPPVFYYAETLSGLGNMYRTAGDFDKSNFYYKQGKAFLEKHYDSNHYDIAYFNYKIGAVYYEKMEYQNALDSFLDARKVWVNHLEPQEKYMRYLNEAIGDMYWELDQPEKALEFFNYSIIDEATIENDLSKKVIHKADSLVTTGNYGAAIDFYKEAYEWRLKEFGNNSVQTGACKNFVARALRFSGDTEAALAAYQEAIQILVPEMNDDSWYANPTPEMKVQSSQYLFESLVSKGELLSEVFKKSGDIKDLEAALQTKEAAINLLENQKNTQLSEASREFWTQRTLNLIESSISTTLNLYQISEQEKFLEMAFNFSERSKALLLLASLYDHEINSFSNVSEAIILEEKTLKKDINEYVGMIQTEENRCADVRGKMLSLWKSKLNSLQNEYDLLVERIQLNYPEYYNLKYNNEIAGVNQIQEEVLDPQTVMISYFIGTEKSFIFCITSEKISVRALENTPEILAQATNLFTSISSPQILNASTQDQFKTFTEVSHWLYSKLVKPEIEAQNFSKLIIIPDGKLCYLPFEVLLTNSVSTSKRDYKSLPYLLKDLAVSYSPSATIKLLSENGKTRSDSYLGFAPNYEGQRYTETLRDGKTLANLHYNGVEIKRASEMLGGKIWIGKEVTEDLLKKNASDAGILHLAMHGAIEDEHPLLSKLYFNSSEMNDGMLHIYEIYNLNINAQLVILSACNTASGALIRGEGIVSLERAFQYAGSKALLSTLWTVDDAASLQLTELFLKKLHDGSTKDMALREAKIEFLANASPEKLHPFYWSSFKLTGNTKPLNKSYKVTYILIGISALSLLLGIIFFRRKNRK